MDLVKSQWVADQNTVHLGVPINKIDKENRLVSGFATLNNVDTAKDVVLAEASKAAFERARKNVREMHQPIAVGKVVDFREDEFYYDGEFYRGIYATAYVSKGAEDTWQKVLDGTLTGFSIGGNITDFETKFVKDAGPHGETIRFIKAYDLVELSLVDNPGNSLTNFDSIVKMMTFEGDTGNKIMKGMVAETVIVNVFWCGTDEIAKNSTNATETCLSCGMSMEQIGWFERGEDNAVKTASAVATFLGQREGTVNKAETTAQGEGGVDMSDKKTKKEDEQREAAKEEAAEAGVEVKQEEGEPATLENSPEVVESDEDEKEDDKEEPTGDKVDANALALGAQLPEDSAETDEKFEEKREKTAEEHAEATKKEEAAMPDFEKMFGDLKDSLATEFKKSLDELRTDLESKIEGSSAGVEKRLETLEGSTALKKSGEVETEPVKKTKESLWSGTFFDATA